MDPGLYYDLPPTQHIIRWLFKLKSSGKEPHKTELFLRGGGIFRAFRGKKSFAENSESNYIC